MAHSVAEIEAVLVAASAEDLSDWDRQFVEDNLKRIAELGDETPFTARQWEQIERLEARYCRPKTGGHNVGGIVGEALRQIVDRIERLEEEKSGLAGDIRDVYAQAKSQGFDTKIIRQVIKRRKLEDQEREEIDQLLELYEDAITGALLSS